MKDGKNGARPTPDERMRTEARKYVRDRFGRPSRSRGAANPNVCPALDTERLGSILFMLTGKPVNGNPAHLPARELANYADQLRRALARERGKSRSGHYSYDANRHIALHQTLRQIESIMATQAKPDPKQENSPGRAG